MRDFLAKKVVDLKPSGIRKFFDIASEIEDVISLGVGEPDFDTPWHIREEGIYSLERGKTYYTSNSGLLGLRKAISEYNKTKYKLDYNPKNEILVTVGGSEAIDIALRSVIEDGDEVIIPTPCYVSYEPCVKLCGGVVKTINLKNENQFRLQPEEIEKAITNKSKVLIISYPNNPTGAIMEYDDLVKICDVIIKHDLLVISDEIYAELTYGPKHVSIASLPGMRERTIVVNGFSKAFSMTGWRLGYAMGPEEILKQMTKIHQFCIMCAPTNSQYAAIEALKNGDNDVVNMRNAYDERRRFLINWFKNMNIPMFMPMGAFYIFPDISQFGLTSDEFALRLLNEEKVVVVPGTAFGDSGEGFIRISYAYSIEDLKKALSRVENFINRLRNSGK
ncbi:MAG: aminotransferase class I/II-fold pyridoxal phosphate-dependent enzyme [Acholeplasmatales bacterium]|nr:aminotransferase class I/II-fold pyridoxal phosphate-dependent enzyme [Acholeplasmatales bacterium]